MYVSKYFLCHNVFYVPSNNFFYVNLFSLLNCKMYLCVIFMYLFIYFFWCLSIYNFFILSSSSGIQKHFFGIFFFHYSFSLNLTILAKFLYVFSFLGKMWLSVCVYVFVILSSKVFSLTCHPFLCHKIAIFSPFLHVLIDEIKVFLIIL